MKSEDLMRVLEEDGVCADSPIIMDSEYALPTETWLLNDFKEATIANLKKLGIDTYAKEANDCDDFAWTVAGLARIGNARQGCKKALAFGVFAYKTDEGGLHAINFSVVRVGANDYRLIFIEPQTGCEVELSRSERTNCLFFIV